MTTPAQRAGLEIGKIYMVGDTMDSYPVKGTLLKFVYDDDSSIPKFDIVDATGRTIETDQYEYIQHLVLDCNGKAVAFPEANKGVKFEKATRTIDTTVITVDRELTEAEELAISAIISKGN